MVGRFRAATFLGCCLALCGLASAQTPATPVLDKQAVDDVALGREAAAERYRADAQAIKDSSIEALKRAADHPVIPEVQRGAFSIVEESLPEGALQSRDRFADEPSAFLVFASTSMPERDLLALFEVASDQPNVHVIFRGVPEGGGIDGFMRYLSDLCKDLGVKPTMTIDPPQWVERNITVAPTIVALENGVEIGRATGTANPSWLREQLVARKGDLGAYGEVYAPAERDMADVIREAVAAIDTDQLRRDAEKTFWAQQPRLDLPMVAEARVTRVDPSVEVTKDVVLPDGKILAKKGDRINPLLATDFDQRLIVINGADPAQRMLAKSLVAGAQKRVVVMSTQGPTDADSPDTWTNWQNDVEQRMYLLNPQLQSTLRVARVPTMIEADGPVLVLTEMLTTAGSP